MSEDLDIGDTAPDPRDMAPLDAAQAEQRARLRKSPNAFRTISEVADDLHIPQHVLRFWETKFPQVKPMKRGGGRRYYRPDDIALLRRISDLLYIQGYTIKGVQRMLRETGGQLPADIPPPGPDETEGGDDMMLPLLDLSPPPDPQPRRPRDMIPPRRPETATEAELDRLRRLLAQTLIELETLRDMIG